MMTSENRSEREVAGSGDGCVDGARNGARHRLRFGRRDDLIVRAREDHRERAPAGKIGRRVGAQRHSAQCVRDSLRSRFVRELAHARVQPGRCAGETIFGSSSFVTASGPRASAACACCSRRARAASASAPARVQSSSARSIRSGKSR